MIPLLWIRRCERISGGMDVRKEKQRERGERECAGELQLEEGMYDFSQSVPGQRQLYGAYILREYKIPVQRFSIRRKAKVV